MFRLSVLGAVLCSRWGLAKAPRVMASVSSEVGV